VFIADITHNFILGLVAKEIALKTPVTKGLSHEAIDSIAPIWKNCV
jgi:hypothetical protein